MLAMHLGIVGDSGFFADLERKILRFSRRNYRATYYKRETMQIQLLLLAIAHVFCPLMQQGIITF